MERTTSISRPPSGLRRRKRPVWISSSRSGASLGGACILAIAPSGAETPPSPQRSDFADLRSVKNLDQDRHPRAPCVEAFRARISSHVPILGVRLAPIPPVALFGLGQPPSEPGARLPDGGEPGAPTTAWRPSSPTDRQPTPPSCREGQDPRPENPRRRSADQVDRGPKSTSWSSS
jgi:hypothetical protein